MKMQYICKMAAKTNQLNDKQRKFAQLVAAGEAIRVAYIKVYGKVKSPDSQASRLASNAKVSAYIEKLRSKIEEKAVLTAARKREILREIAESPVDGELTKHSDRVKAIEVDNKMAGHDAPQKIEHSGTIDLRAVLWGDDDAS